VLGLKEDDTYAVLSAQGMAENDQEGIYRHDTRFLSRYRWHFGPFELLMQRAWGNRLIQHWSWRQGPSQLVGLRRELRVERGRILETLSFENTSLEPHAIQVGLELQAEFADLFEVSGWHHHPRDIKGLHYRAQDGLEFSVELHPPLNRWEFNLAPHEEQVLHLEVLLKSPLTLEGPPLPSLERWRDQFPLRPRHPEVAAVIEQALEDLRTLLLITPQGPYPAAGLPRFIAPFGRDGLITAYMILPWGADLARSILLYLAAHQGQQYDPYRDEEPGKILHEYRVGELSRLGKVPFGPYYGSVDATPLFLIVLEAYWQTTKDSDLLRQLQPHWEAALSWIHQHADSEGLLRFHRDQPGGLSVQSWKDSADSMSHRDGRLASPPLAVSEVQGYVYAAYRAASTFYQALKDPRAQLWAEQAQRLQTVFHQRFWLPELQTYGLALDADQHPLEVLSSDPGQLLWTGIVPSSVAPQLVATLFSEPLWSGWGLRTLGSCEVRYNPLSYHNGSVWPHDTALFAGGLARYGFRREAVRVAETLFELALSQPDLRLPELVGGYSRHPGEPPIPYPDACRPQAWDAASLIYTLQLAAKLGSSELLAVESSIPAQEEPNM
jgi:glycogen debranching enzyme